MFADVNWTLKHQYNVLTNLTTMHFLIYSNCGLLDLIDTPLSLSAVGMLHLFSIS